MRTRIVAYLLLVPFILAGSCQKELEPKGYVEIKIDNQTKSLLESDNNFAFEVITEINKSEDESSNFMISPLSISLALAMTYNGADGSTKEAIENVLKLHGMDVEQINSSYEKLMVALLSVDPAVVVEVANSIWYRDSFSVSKEFLDINKTFYNAEVSGLNFNDPNTLDIINGWVKENTHNKIQKIITQIDPNDIMFLINAIYFKGDWTYSFNENETKEAPFFDADRTYLKEVPTMALKADLKVQDTESFQALELPYGTGNYSMFILLPKAGYHCTDIIDKLDLDEWKSLVNSMYLKQGLDVYLPKFSFEYKKELKEILTNLGMGVAFSTAADFTKINPSGNLNISSVKHKTFIEVNEKGTEAAAVTSVTISLTSIQPSNEFRADHPFLYLIRENSTGAIVFMGKVANP